MICDGYGYPLPPLPGRVMLVSGAQLATRTMTGDAAMGVVKGDALGDRFGRFVVPMGDLNGDGITDIVVGTGSQDALYVVPLSAWRRAEPVWVQAVAHTTIEVVDVDSVVGVGDVDGDGLEDLVVTRKVDLAGLQDGGRILVFSGASLAGGAVVEADATSVAESLLTQIGGDAVVLPDLDGDGLSELSARIDNATVGVWFGSTLATPGALPATGDAQVLGWYSPGRLGSDLFNGFERFPASSVVPGAVLGPPERSAWQEPVVRPVLPWVDADGDGAPELVSIVGSGAKGDEWIEVHLHDGAQVSGVYTPDDFLSADCIPSYQPIGRAGALPDLDGDGVVEAYLLTARVGAPRLAELRVWSSSDLVDGTFSYAEPDGRFVGGVFGLTVAPVSDLDGDGLPDVLIGNEAPTP